MNLNELSLKRVVALTNQIIYIQKELEDIKNEISRNVTNSTDTRNPHMKVIRCDNRFPK